MNEVLDAAAISVPMPVPLPLLAAADLQDHLLTAGNDLDRLQTLLHGACEALLASFHGAATAMQRMSRHTDAPQPAADAAELATHLNVAVTALQFQDMASQLIAHTSRRLRNCADRLAADAMGDDDEDGVAVVEEAPLRPNPVRQHEMDAGSVELF